MLLDATGGKSTEAITLDTVPCPRVGYGSRLAYAGVNTSNKK